MMMMVVVLVIKDKR